MTRTCKYEPCSTEFEPAHPRQEFCTPTCRTNQHYLDHPEKGRALVGGAFRCVATHPLVDARAEQEASELNDRLGQIVYNAIIDRLKTTGSVHADDLEPYFPEEHRDRCRKLIGGQFGSLSGRHCIAEVERRKSTVPTRKGAKSGVYVFTAKGRAKLVGHRADGVGNVSPVPGEKPSEVEAGVPDSQGPGGVVISPDPTGGSSDGCVSGAIPASAPDTPPEPLELPIEDDGNYRDWDQRAA